MEIDKKKTKVFLEVWLALGVPSKYEISGGGGQESKIMSGIRKNTR